MSTSAIYVEIYHCPERDAYDVRVVGSDDWDSLSDLSEQEARDEAEAIAVELGVEVVRV